jgi:hypothetical protein
MDIPNSWDPCRGLANWENKECGQWEDSEEEQVVVVAEAAAWAEVNLEPEEEEWAI